MERAFHFANMSSTFRAFGAFLSILLYVQGQTQVGDLECHLDSKVNPETWASYITEVGFVFEAACGRNR